jgi:hypothetical protein
MKGICKLVSIVTVILSISTVNAQNWNMNIKGGVMLPGTVSIEGVEFDTETGWIINTAYDAMVAEKLSMGGYFFYSGVTAEYNGEGANIMAIGGTIKGRFPMRGGNQIRAGIILAYQMTSGDVFDDVEGLNVGFTGEFIFPLKNKKAVVTEIGFTTQPAGGNADADVTWAPIFYLTVGYEFGG